MTQFERKLIVMGLWTAACIVLMFINFWAAIAFLLGGITRPESIAAIDLLIEDKIKIKLDNR